MQKVLVPGAAVLTVTALAFACGGGSGGPSTPTPNPTSTPPITINIVGDRANQSFSPNPAQENGTGMAMWRNSDNQVHRIVANDGSFDTGEIAGGATSRSIRVAAEGTNYHCSLHTGMVGTIRSSGGNAPPCTGPYC